MILASQSAQRKKLMKMLFDEFDIISFETDENFDSNLSIYDNLKNIAYEKAIAVFENNEIVNDYIIGVDTIVYFDDKILLKPQNYEEAFEMIKSYRGKEQEVISGVSFVVVKDKKIIDVKKDVVISKVKFNNLSDEKIKKWLELDLYKFCSGSFMIEKIEDDFQMEISGSYSNIIGLPLERISEMLSEYNLDTKNIDIGDIKVIKKYMEV